MTSCATGLDLPPTHEYWWGDHVTFHDYTTLLWTGVDWYVRVTNWPFLSTLHPGLSVDIDLFSLQFICLKLIENISVPILKKTFFLYESQCSLEIFEAILPIINLITHFLLVEQPLFLLYNTNKI